MNHWREICFAWCWNRPVIRLPERKSIRDDIEISRMPIIMLSGKVHRDAIQEGLDAGANRYLAKPMSRTGLLQEMREVLDEAAVAN